MNDTSGISSPYELFIATATLNSIISMPLNVYVMWLIVAGTKETLASDCFSLNLAMSEILFTLNCIWYFVSVQMKSLLCFEVFMFSRGLLSTARPLFLCCICIEYYVGVVHPVLFLRFKPLRYRVACCCVVWLITLVSCIYSISTYTNNLYLYGYFIQYFLFFSVMLFCCCSVLRALKRPGPGENDTEKKNCNRIKRRAFKIIFLIMSFSSINLCLYMVVIPLQCCLKHHGFPNAMTICTSLALTTGFIQPILYLHRAGKGRCFREL